MAAAWEALSGSLVMEVVVVVSLLSTAAAAARGSGDEGVGEEEGALEPASACAAGSVDGVCEPDIDLEEEVVEMFLCVRWGVFRRERRNQRPRQEPLSIPGRVGLRAGKRGPCAKREFSRDVWVRARLAGVLIVQLQIKVRESLLWFVRGCNQCSLCESALLAVDTLLMQQVIGIHAELVVEVKLARYQNRLSLC